MEDILNKLHRYSNSIAKIVLSDNLILSHEPYYFDDNLKLIQFYNFNTSEESKQYLNENDVQILIQFFTKISKEFK